MFCLTPLRVDACYSCNLVKDSTQVRAFPSQTAKENVQPTQGVGSTTRKRALKGSDARLDAASAPSKSGSWAAELARTQARNAAAPQRPAESAAEALAEGAGKQAPSAQRERNMFFWPCSTDELSVEAALSLPLEKSLADAKLKELPTESAPQEERMYELDEPEAEAQPLSGDSDSQASGAVAFPVQALDAGRWLPSTNIYELQRLKVAKTLERQSLTVAGEPPRQEKPLEPLEKVEAFLAAQGFPPGDVNAMRRRRMQTDSPLHVAVLKNDANMVALLLQERADPLLRNSKGLTPLRLARKCDKNLSHREILRILSMCDSPRSDIDDV